MIRSYVTSVSALALLAACSTAPKPPSHAGTLIVHAAFAAGPDGPGITPTQGAIPNTRVRIAARGGVERTATTNDIGNVTFAVAPGIYVARLADLQKFEGTGGKLDCGGGTEPAKVTVPPDGKVWVSLACWGEG